MSGSWDSNLHPSGGLRYHSFSSLCRQGDTGVGNLCLPQQLGNIVALHAGEEGVITTWSLLIATTLGFLADMLSESVKTARFEHLSSHMARGLLLTRKQHSRTQRSAAILSKIVEVENLLLELH